MSIAKLDNGMEINYIVDGYDVATITGLHSSNGVDKLIIPEEIDGYDVSHIKADAFYGNKVINEVHIPDSIVNINDDAFYGCNIKKLTFAKAGSGSTRYRGDNITISFRAFMDNKIEELILPEKDIGLDDDAFSGNEIKGKLVLPNGLNNIGYRAFQHNLITSVEFDLDNSTLSYIGYEAFLGNKIPYVIMPKSVKSLRPQCFPIETLVICSDGAIINGLAENIVRIDKDKYDEIVKNVTSNIEKLDAIGTRLRNVKSIYNLASDVGTNILKKLIESGL